MSKHHRPMTWFCVNKWGAVTQCEFVRETERMLFKANGRRECKKTTFDEWFRNAEDAANRSAEILAERADRKALQLIRAAAPDLLEALETMTAFAEKVIERVGLRDTNNIVGNSKAIIAKAKGGEA